MPEEHGALAHHVVDQPVPVSIEQVGAFRRFEEDGVGLLTHPDVAVNPAGNHLPGTLEEAPRLLEAQLENLALHLAHLPGQDRYLFSG